MASSNFKTPPTAQHYLACGTEDCENNCQFYCNPCHRPMCEQCKDNHQKSPNNQNHEMVPYQLRIRQLPEIKCQTHINRYVDMLCEQCQVPVCSKCATQDHGRHTFIDLETVYAEKCAICLDEINKIEEYFLPTSQDLLKSIRKDSKEMKKIMDDIRASMRAKAESLKSMVDAATSDKIKEVNKIEKSILQLLNSQDKRYNGYISYLYDLVKQFHDYLCSKDIKTLVSKITTNLKVDPIPETTKPVPAVFTAAQYTKEDVSKLLGRVNVPDTKPEKRKIKPNKTLKPTVPTKVKEYTVQGVDSVHHISQGNSSGLWVSDLYGNLVKTDLQGNVLQKIESSCKHGYHTITQGEELIYADRNNKVINRVTQDGTDTEFIETGEWGPISIHSSNITGDILVGMKTKTLVRNREAKVTRYNKSGKEIQNIEIDEDGQELYSDPHYITENINGDICTSDFNKQAVVVVNKSGQHRFSYTNEASVFRPYSICTDFLGHIILVCNIPHLGLFMKAYNYTIHILDQHGQFLSLLLTPGQEIEDPRSLCVDDENNLHVGQWDTNTVTVYKYLQ
nr:uncharacterized protein LOC117684384 [Crassostrea gigas]